MAVNDPTYGVPTPTGTLQGVAAFSWDGATWQPSARASIGVGTPTGVLRGVAPFTWSGSAWTPAGGGPDVATPGGVLQGVAVYTWSGSAWVPAGGPDAATPTGVLQGVAAFTWDGTAWQPAGQAGPDVATPNGVLQGVAMFSWGGTGWTPTSAGTALDINFVNTTTLDGRVTFTRASTATYFDSTGTMQTAGNNAPRFEYDPTTFTSRGLLIEESRTNVSSNGNMVGAVAGTPGTDPTGWILNAGLGLSKQIVATGTINGMAYIDLRYFGTATAGNLFPQTAGANTATTAGTQWTASAYMALVGGSLTNVGGIFLNCNFSAGSPGNIAVNVQPGLAAALTRFSVSGAPGTGVATISPIFWNISIAAGPVDCTLRIAAPQLEQGAFVTSYIPTTGATVTRAADLATTPIGGASAPWRNATAETYGAEMLLITAQNTNCRVLSDPGSPAAYVLMGNSNGAAGIYDGAGFLQTGNAATPGAVAKAVCSWASPNSAKACLNGGAVATSTSLTGGFIGSTVMKLGGDNAPTDQMNGYLRRVRYWPRVLSNAEMQQVTT